MRCALLSWEKAAYVAFLSMWEVQQASADANSRLAARPILIVYESVQRFGLLEAGPGPDRYGNLLCDSVWRCVQSLLPNVLLVAIIESG
jgi:hypothetical protein